MFGGKTKCVLPLEGCLHVGGLLPSIIRSLKRILTTSEPPKATKKEKKVVTFGFKKRVATRGLSIIVTRDGGCLTCGNPFFFLTLFLKVRYARTRLFWPRPS